MTSKNSNNIFTSSYVFTIVGLLASFVIGYWHDHSIGVAFKMVFLALILAVLEVSLSFDNAVINASVLKRMTPLWQKRFLTWGMLIAVFGMRLVFPLAIVAILLQIDPWSALILALDKPDEYAKAMHEAHIPLAGFGGTFLMMVALKYFFDANKETHWVAIIEKPLVHLGKVEAGEMAICLMWVYFVSRFLPDASMLPFLTASIFGLVTFVVVDGVSALLETSDQKADLHKASFSLFLYLEILDASFSFDGVVGAFALTHNLLIITIGLGIGAMFVRSMTIYLVRRQTLDQLPFLEHGAFYAIGALAAMMYLGTFIEVPEVLTGLIGAVLLGLSVWSSIRFNRRKARGAKMHSAKKV